MMPGLEEKMISEIKTLVSENNKIRDVGKNIINELSGHIIKKHSPYLTILDQKDLQLTVEFFGIKIRIKVHVDLDVVVNVNYRLEAYLIPEKEKEDLIPLDTTAVFDYLGNIDKQHMPKDFPIYFVKKLIDEIVKKKTSMR